MVKAMTVYLGKLYLSDNVVCIHITVLFPPGHVHVINTRIRKLDKDQFLNRS